MPWECRRCSEKGIVDSEACPGCGQAKTTWTIVADQTRTIRVMRKQLELKRGVETRACSQDEAWSEVVLEPTEVLPVVPRAYAQQLAQANLLPPTSALLFAVAPKKHGALRVEVMYERKEVASLELAEDEAEEDGDQRIWTCLVICGSGEEVTFPGIRVFDITEEDAPHEFAPWLQVCTAGKQRPLHRVALRPCITLRLPADPDQDTYRLTSNHDEQGDPGYERTLTVQDDRVLGDAWVDLLFLGVDPESEFTLEIDPHQEDGHTVFEGVPYSALATPAEQEELVIEELDDDEDAPGMPDDWVDDIDWDDEEEVDDDDDEELEEDDDSDLEPLGGLAFAAALPEAPGSSGAGADPAAVRGSERLIGGAEDLEPIEEFRLPPKRARVMVLRQSRRKGGTILFMGAPEEPPDYGFWEARFPGEPYRWANKGKKRKRWGRASTILQIYVETNPAGERVLRRLKQRQWEIWSRWKQAINVAWPPERVVALCDTVAKVAHIPRRWLLGTLLHEARGLTHRSTSCKSTFGSNGIVGTSMARPKKHRNKKDPITGDTLNRDVGWGLGQVQGIRGVRGFTQRPLRRALRKKLRAEAKAANERQRKAWKEAVSAAKRAGARKPKKPKKIKAQKVAGAKGRTPKIPIPDEGIWWNHSDMINPKLAIWAMGFRLRKSYEHRWFGKVPIEKLRMEEVGAWWTGAPDYEEFLARRKKAHDKRRKKRIEEGKEDPGPWVEPKEYKRARLYRHYAKVYGSPTWRAKVEAAKKRWPEDLEFPDKSKMRAAQPEDWDKGSWCWFPR